MNLHKTVVEKFGMMRPAARTTLVVILILAQCCVCILPLTVMSQFSGSEMAGGSSTVVVAGSTLPDAGAADISGIFAQVVHRIEVIAAWGSNFSIWSGG